MKINILHQPSDDLCKNRRNVTQIFIAFLAVACCGVVIGVYAIIADTFYYSQLEKWALILFVSPTPFITYFGEKLQSYKKLTPPQQKELASWSMHYQEIRVCCDLAATSGRQPIRAEYEVCQAWAEAASRQSR